MKGIISTVVVLLFAFAFLGVYLAYTGYILSDANSVSRASPLSYPEYYSEDLSADIASYTALCAVSRSGQNISMAITDYFPRTGVSPALDSYESFIEGNYSNSTGYGIRLNLTPMRDGSYEIEFSDGNFYSHDYNSSLVQSALFSTNGTSTGLQEIVINVSAQGTRIGIIPWTWNPSGDTGVVVFYSDSNGTYNDSGRISSSALSTYTFLLQNASVVLTYGLLPKQGSLGFIATNAPARLELNLTMQNQSELSYWYNATASYSRGSLGRNVPLLIGKS